VRVEIREFISMKARSTGKTPRHPRKRTSTEALVLQAFLTSTKNRAFRAFVRDVLRPR